MLQWANQFILTACRRSACASEVGSSLDTANLSSKAKLRAWKAVTRFKSTGTWSTSISPSASRTSATPETGPFKGPQPTLTAPLSLAHTWVEQSHPSQAPFICLYVCVCVYVYVAYIYIYVYVCMYVYEYVFKYVCESVYVYIYVYVYVCMNICIHVCMYIYICAYICVYVYVCTYVFVRVCIYVNAYMYVRMYVCVCIYVYVYMYMHMCVCVCMYIYRYMCGCIYVCIHKYMYVCMCIRTTHNARTGTLVPTKSVALSASACQVSLHWVLSACECSRFVVHWVLSALGVLSAQCTVHSAIQVHSLCVFSCLM